MSVKYGICERCGEREGWSCSHSGPWKIVCGACYIPANWTNHRTKVRGSSRKISLGEKNRRKKIFREFAARYDARK